MALRKGTLRAESKNQSEYSVFLTVCKECDQKINQYVRDFFNMKAGGKKILTAEVIDLLVKRLPEILIAEKI
jgi:hypothetical protein